MRYRQLVKTVDTNDFYEANINLNQIKAQYNPERFHFWKSLHKGPEKEALNMFYSPHYKFLRNRKNKSYHQLQRMFGRNDKWIKNKIDKFLDVFESIKNEGFKESIVVVERPLVKNDYNKGYEIFEGHHRVACALVLGIEKIPCKIIRRKNENNKKFG